MHLQLKHYYKKSSFTGLITTIPAHLQWILMSLNYLEVITWLLATSLLQDAFIWTTKEFGALECRKINDASCEAEFYNVWLCSFHAKDLHWLGDHWAGVRLAVDAHYEGLVEQDVGMFCKEDMRVCYNTQLQVWNTHLAALLDLHIV